MVMLLITLIILKFWWLILLIVVLISWIVGCYHTQQRIVAEQTEQEIMRHIENGTYGEYLERTLMKK